jgi:biotin transport system ATP-binding protein
MLAGFDRVLVFDDGRLVGDDRPDAAIQRYLELLA